MLCKLLFLPSLFILLCLFPIEVLLLLFPLGYSFA